MPESMHADVGDPTPGGKVPQVMCSTSKAITRTRGTEWCVSSTEKPSIQPAVTTPETERAVKLATVLRVVDNDNRRYLEASFEQDALSDVSQPAVPSSE